MAGIQDILNRIDNEEIKIIHITSEKDRRQNKEYWKDYNRKLHRFNLDGYKTNDWYDVNEYMYNHCEGDY